MTLRYETTTQRDGVTYRTCNGCKRDLPLNSDNYYRASAFYLGFEYRCKLCERERARWRNMLRLYGLSQHDYTAMLEAQGGLCAACKSPPRGGITSTICGDQMFDIDHDHVEGHVRGLLCRVCNRILGNVDDSPDHLRALADYLERNTRP